MHFMQIRAKLFSARRFASGGFCNMRLNPNRLGFWEVGQLSLVTSWVSSVQNTLFG